MSEPPAQAGGSSSLRVYDGDEVDDYIARLHAHVEQLKAEIVALRDESSSGSVAGPASDASERVLGRALLQAQRVADEAVLDGRRQRDALLEAGRMEGESIVDAARRQVAQLVAGAHAERGALLDAARVEGDGLLSQARTEAQALLFRTRSQVEAVAAEWDRYLGTQLAGSRDRILSQFDAVAGQYLTPSPSGTVNGHRPLARDRVDAPIEGAVVTHSAVAHSPYAPPPAADEVFQGDPPRQSESSPQVLPRPLSAPPSSPPPLPAYAAPSGPPAPEPAQRNDVSALASAISAAPPPSGPPVIPLLSTDGTRRERRSGPKRRVGGRGKFSR
jgi:cell division septum initiation protein DivIVA